MRKTQTGSLIDLIEARHSDPTPTVGQNTCQQPASFRCEGGSKFVDCVSSFRCEGRFQVRGLGEFIQV